MKTLNITQLGGILTAMSVIAGVSCVGLHSFKDSLKYSISSAFSKVDAQVKAEAPVGDFNADKWGRF